MPSPQQLQCPTGQGSSMPSTGKCQILCLSGNRMAIDAVLRPPGAVVGGLGQCCPAGSDLRIRKTGLCQPLIKNPAGQDYRRSSHVRPAQLGKDGTCCKARIVAELMLAAAAAHRGQAAATRWHLQIDRVSAAGEKQSRGSAAARNDLKAGWHLRSKTACGPGKGRRRGASNACCDASHIFVDGDGHPQCCPGSVSNGKCQPLGGTPRASENVHTRFQPIRICLRQRIQADLRWRMLPCKSDDTERRLPALQVQAPGGPGNNQCQPGFEKPRIPAPGKNGDGGSGGNQCCMGRHDFQPQAGCVVCSPDSGNAGRVVLSRRTETRSAQSPCMRTDHGLRRSGDIGETVLAARIRICTTISAGHPQCCRATRQSPEPACAPAVQHPGAAAVCRGLHADAGPLMLARNRFVSADWPHLPARPSQMIVPVVPKLQIAPPVDCSARGTEFCPKLRQPERPASDAREDWLQTMTRRAVSGLRGRRAIRSSSPASCAAAWQVGPPGQLRRPAPAFLRGRYPGRRHRASGRHWADAGPPGSMASPKAVLMAVILFPPGAKI